MRGKHKRFYAFANRSDNLSIFCVVEITENNKWLLEVSRGSFGAYRPRHGRWYLSCNFREQMSRLYL